MSTFSFADERTDPFTGVLGASRGGGRRPPAAITVTNPGPESNPMWLPPPAAGRSFTFRVVYKGERYGRDDCLTNAELDPLIEAYDATYAGDPRFAATPWGQFTGGRYRLSALLDGEAASGLPLDMGVPEWTVHATAMAPVMEWLRSLQ